MTHWQLLGKVGQRRGSTETLTGLWNTLENRFALLTLNELAQMAIELAALAPGFEISNGRRGPQ